MQNISTDSILNKLFSKKIKVLKYKPTHTETEMSLKDFCEKYKDNLENAISNFIALNEEQFPYDSKFTDLYTEGTYYFCKNFIKNFNENAYTGSLIQSNEEYSELGAKGLITVNTYDIQNYKQMLKTMEYIHIIPCN